MTAFFIATVSIKNPEKFQQYAAKAGETMAPFGGEAVLRGKSEKSLTGTTDHQAVGIVQFANMGQLNQWYNSDAYQAIIPLRNEAADMTIVTYNAM